jgi:enterochelin esterase-like enzyme
MRAPPPRALVALVTVALGIVGLVGAYSYWEAYYQHRGFATVAFLPHARHGQLQTVHFYSPALHRTADYLVYTPPGYDADPARPTRYPVYYLLHGSPGRPVVFTDIAQLPVRMDNLISLHRMRPMILVFPDGRIGGSTYSDSEWANTPSGRLAAYVVNVVHDVDHRFRTVARREDRVIAGFSAGAYGATNIALRNLRVFANLQAWSGYYVETRTGVFGHAGAATLRANSPLDYVRRLKALIAKEPLRAFLFVGRDDDDSPQTGPMASALAAAGGSVTWALYHGGHDWQLWHAHLDQMLMLASRDTSVPPRRSDDVARSLTPGVVPIPHGRGSRQRHRATEPADRRKARSGARAKGRRSRVPPAR